MRAGKLWPPMEAHMAGRLTAALTVRVSPEADQIRRELEAEMKLPANRVVEAALHTLKDELERRKSTQVGPPLKSQAGQ
jgi:hypothetical protein